MHNRNGALTPPAEIAPSGQDIRTPFLRARQEWDERIGTAVVQKSNWQRLAVALTLAVVILCLAVAFLAGRVTVLPYVVEVGETGEIRSVGILPQQWQGQHTAPLEFVVRQWLVWVRTISSDPVVFAQNWEAARDFLSQKGWALLSDHVRQQHERMKRGETVQIKFGHMLPIAGHARSFEVEWDERAFSQQGYAIPESHHTWRAILKIAVYPPKDVQALKEMRNPLGIFIEEVHWTERAREKGGQP